MGTRVVTDVEVKIEAHAHPRNPSQVVFGYRLQPGEIIRRDDVYDSTSGTWEKAPCPGLTLGEGNATIWVRTQATMTAT